MTGVQTCALPIFDGAADRRGSGLEVGDGPVSEDVSLGGIIPWAHSRVVGAQAERRFSNRLRAREWFGGHLAA